MQCIGPMSIQEVLLAAKQGKNFGASVITRLQDAKSCLCGNGIPCRQVHQNLLFAGTFKAGKPGAAQQFLKSLSQKMKELSEVQRTCKVLKSAIETLTVPEGCTGSAAVICNGELMFSVIGTLRNPTMYVRIFLGSQSPTCSFTVRAATQVLCLLERVNNLIFNTSKREDGKRDSGKVNQLL